MNKYFLNITLLTFVLLLYSCAEQSMEQNEIVVTKSSVAKLEAVEVPFLELEGKELTTEQLKAFEQRAIQKIEDFTDYVTIISNPQTDEALKNHSLDLSLELFKNDSITIEYPEFTDRSSSTVKAFLVRIKTNKHLLKAKIKSLKISKPLSRDSLNNYSGLITATIKLGKHKIDKTVGIHLINTQKDFGENIQTINEVRLGNIY